MDIIKTKVIRRVAGDDYHLFSCIVSVSSKPYWWYPLYEYIVLINIPVASLYCPISYIDLLTEKFLAESFG